MSLHSEPHEKLTVDGLHRIVDQVVIADDNVAYYEVVLTDSKGDKLHVADEIYLDTVNKRMVLVVD